MLKGVLMNKNAVPITIVVCVLIVAAAAAVIVLKLHKSDSGSPSPISTVTITASTPPSSGQPTPRGTPVVTPSAPAAPLSDFTVCITPTVGCNGELRTQPTQIIVSGDGSAFIKDLSWTGWGSDGATGSGTLELDNCEPNCAQGKDAPYQATVTVSGLTAYAGGKQAYADMTVTAPGSSYGTQSYHGLLP
jgi:hypothetical protein